MILPEKMNPWVGCFLAACSGVLTVMAFEPFGLSNFVFITIPLFLYCLTKLTKAQSFWAGAAWGLGYFGFGASWIYVSISTYGNVGTIISVVITALFVMIMATYIAYLASSFRYFYSGRYKFLSLVLFFPSLWITYDWLRAWLFTGFPWLYLGDSQVGSMLSVFIPVVGSAGVTWLICAMSGILILILDGTVSKSQKLIIGLVSVIGLVGSWNALQDKSWVIPHDKEYSMVAVQPNLPQEIKWNPLFRKQILQNYWDLTKKHQDHDIIVWSENALPLFKNDAQKYLDKLEQDILGKDTSLVMGIPIRGDNKETYYNSMMVLGDGEGIYHKRHLVPFGEFIPFQPWTGKLLDWFNLPLTDFTEGDDFQKPLTARGIRIAPAICYEIAYSSTIRDLAQMADMIITVSNDTWFGRSIGPFQHLQIAQVRALETGRPILRATNNGITAYIDFKGKIIEQLPQFHRAELAVKVRPTLGLTPYVQYGDRLRMAFMSFFLVIFLVVSRTKEKEDWTTS